MRKQILFLRLCFWIGALADLLATVPLLFPEAVRVMFGLSAVAEGSDYFYASRIAASLMLGWTGLLVWGSCKPVERKAVLLLTVAPVLAGLAGASVLAVRSGFTPTSSMLPLWFFYAVIIPLYISAYLVAGKARAAMKD